MSYAKEFRQRHLIMRRKSRPWYVLIAASAVIGVFTGRVTQSSPPHLLIPGIIAGALLLAGIIGLFFTIQKHYRCPACEQVISTAWMGVPLFPKKCRRCGANYAE